MANSEIEQTKSPCLNEIDKYVSAKPFSLKMYPASVKELSTLLMHARKESLPICDDANVEFHAPSSWGTESRAVFKKSHTCGSLFVKCGCNNENTDGQSLFQTFSDPYSSFPFKRSSNPSVITTHNKPANSKRLSNPEISNSQLLEKRGQSCLNNRPKSVGHFLNHPEIPYPIPKEACDRSLPNSRRSSSKDSIDCPDIYCKRSNLDYHKCTVLAYENCRQDSEEAQKILKEFGILDSMGNGVTLRQNHKASVDHVDILRKHSKNDSTNKSSGREDHEYLKSIITRLKNELSDLEIKYGALQSELVHTQKQLSCKESEVLRLQREIHKLKVSSIYVNRELHPFIYVRLEIY